VFSLAPSGDALADVLAEAIATALREAEPPLAQDVVLPSAAPSADAFSYKSRLKATGGLVVVSATDHDSRVFTEELLRVLLRYGVLPGNRLETASGLDDGSDLLLPLCEADPAAVALVAGPQDAARLLVAWRQEGLLIPVFGGPSLGHHAFVESAGEHADGVFFPLLWDPRDGGFRARDFAVRFQARFGAAPDYTAAYVYDAVNLLIAAIHLAGLNRPLIRDAVRDLAPWNGVTGAATWDPTGQNQPQVRLGVIRAGAPGPLSYPKGLYGNNVNR
jgi:ABC-type branched-subunit amino acid transport system substrate-binding protein